MDKATVGLRARPGPCARRPQDRTCHLCYGQLRSDQLFSPQHPEPSLPA